MVELSRHHSGAIIVTGKRDGMLLTKMPNISTEKKQKLLSEVLEYS